MAKTIFISSLALSVALAVAAPASAQLSPERREAIRRTMDESFRCVGEAMARRLWALPSPGAVVTAAFDACQSVLAEADAAGGGKPGETRAIMRARAESQVQAWREGRER